MKIKSARVKARHVRGEGNRVSSATVSVDRSRRPGHPTTRRVGTYVPGNPQSGKSKTFLYLGIASAGMVLLMIAIIVIVSNDGKKEPVRQPKATVSKSSASSKGKYGAKYAPYDPRMVMTEEPEMAKNRKKRRAESGR